MCSVSALFVVYSDEHFYSRSDKAVFAKKNRLHSFGSFLFYFSMIVFHFNRATKRSCT